MAIATFVHGSPRMVDHTPSGPVSAGDVVAVGDSLRIAHKNIAANELGALATGGGVYDVAKASGTVFADGDLVYFNAGTDLATRTASDTLLGKAVADADNGTTSVRVEHLNYQDT